MDGLAWCRACAGRWMEGACWASYPPAALPAELREDAARLCEERGDLRHATARPSRHGACPLCGMGEAGAEHLWLWCPAAELAWRRFCTSRTSWAEALLGEQETANLAALMVSQIVFLHTALLDKVTLTAEESTRRIVAAVRASMNEPGAHSDDEGETLTSMEGQPATAALPRDYATWSVDGGCEQCRGASRRSVCGGPPGGRASHPAGQVPQGRSVATARARIASGETIGLLHAERVPAAWLPACAGWWPQPRAVRSHEANADWGCSRCTRCGQHCARLAARGVILAGEEVCVPRGLTPTAGAAHWHTEAYFDGATGRSRLGRVAGAGVVLWRMDAQGAPRCIARAALAMPGGASAPVAESRAAGLAVDLLTRMHEAPPDASLTPLSTRRARVCGDCTQTIRYTNGQARMRVIARREPIDAALDRAWRHGWNIRWQAIRRAHNAAAHAVATAAVAWASRLLARGRRACRSCIVWATGGQAPPEDLTLPALP